MNTLRTFLLVTVAALLAIAESHAQHGLRGLDFFIQRAAGETNATPPAPGLPPGIFSMASNTVSSVLTFDTLIEVGGANRMLLIFIGDGEDSTLTSQGQITDAEETNGTPATLAGHSAIVGEALDELDYGLWTYYLAAPPTGTINIRVTFDGAVTRAWLAAYCITNALQAPPRSFASLVDQISDPPHGLCLGSSSSDLVIDALLFEHTAEILGDPADWVPVSGQTSRAYVAQNNRGMLRSSSKVGTSSACMSWTQQDEAPLNGTMQHAISFRGAN